MSLPTVFSSNRRWRILLLVANGVIQALIAVVMALIVQAIFDRLVVASGTRNSGGYVSLAGGLIAVLAANVLLRWRGYSDSRHLGQSYAHAVRMKLFRHLLRVGNGSGSKFSRGALMLRFVGDLTALQRWVSQGLAPLFVSGLSACLTIVLLGLMEPVIALTIAIALLIVTVIGSFVGPRLTRATREVRRRRGRLAGRLNDRLAGIPVVEAFGQEAREYGEFKKLSRAMRDSLLQRAWFVGMLRALSESGAGFAGLITLIVGIELVTSGQTTPGAIVGAMMVAGLLAPRVQELGRVYEYWNAAQVARRKQEELLSLNYLRWRRIFDTKATERAETPPRLSLRNVCREGALKNINLTVEPGERLGVIGANGSGKTTLLRLISGVIQPNSGELLLDGKVIADSERPEARAVFAMASPDLPLLRGSLEMNLFYGSGDGNKSDAAKIIHLCGLDALIARLRDGLRTPVSEGGKGFSTGERARIVLARALIARPQILLLDEFDANLDAIATNAFYHVFDAYEGSIIFTTHRSESAKRADRLVHLSDGRVLACRAAEEILKDGGGLLSDPSAPKIVVSN